MKIEERNRKIYELYKSPPPGWSLKDIGDLFGISPQRVHQIKTELDSYAIMGQMNEPKNNHHFDKPISATQAAKAAGIPYYIIADWVRRGLVKVLQHPGHACTGKPVLLDPVTLNERIGKYRPRRKVAAVEV